MSPLACWFLGWCRYGFPSSKVEGVLPNELQEAPPHTQMFGNASVFLLSNCDPI